MSSFSLLLSVKKSKADQFFFQDSAPENPAGAEGSNFPLAIFLLYPYNAGPGGGESGCL
jgi:hypothetical protein